MKVRIFSPQLLPVPALLFIAVFMLAPLGIIAVYSFLQADPHGGVRPIFSAESYIRFLFERDLDDSLIFDNSYLRIFLRSFLLALGATIISLAVAFPVAYYMAGQTPARRNFLLLLVTIPFWANLLVRTYCWVLILRDTGLVNNAFASAGLPTLQLMYTSGAILLGLVNTYLPFMVLPIYASLEKMDRRLLEAARDLYANRRQMLRRIVIPLAMPGITAGSLMVFIPSLGAFVAPDLLGGGRNLMIGSLIQLQFASSRNWPFGAAGALILLAFIVLLLGFYFRGAKDKTALHQ